MFRNKAGVYLLTAFLLILAAGISESVFADSEHIPIDKVTEEKVNYKTVEAAYGDITSLTEAPAIPYYPHSSAVVYEGKNAHYVSTLVSYGDQVNAGDPLVEISVFGDEILEEELSLNLTREKEAYALGLETFNKEAAELQTARSQTWDAYGIRYLDIDIAKKAVEREKYIYEEEKLIAEMQEALDELQTENSVQYVTAVQDGVVTDLTLFRPGDILTAGTPVCTIVDRNTTFVATDYPFRYGLDVEVSAHFSNQSPACAGHVIVTSSALPEADVRGALIEIDEPLTGQESFNNINVVGSDVNIENVLLIPKTTWEMVSGKPLVTILDENNVPHRRFINIGFSTKDTTWVINGLEAGDRLIIN